MQYNKQQILELVNHQLLIWIKKDETVRDAVFELVNLKFETKNVSEDKFTRILSELQKDRIEQTKKWDEWKAENKKEWDKWKAENKKEWDEWKVEDKKKWDEWREENKKIWNEIVELKKEDKNLSLRIDENYSKLRQDILKFGSRWGKNAESTFRNAIKGILKDLKPDLQIIHYDEFDPEGMVYDGPSSIEMDFIIKNDKTYLFEISARVGKGEISIFKRKVKFYEKKHNTKVDQLIVISPEATEEVKRSAENGEIKLFTYVEDLIL